MAKIVGLSNQEMMQQAYANTKADIKKLVENQRNHIDALIKELQDEGTSNDLWGYIGSPTFGVIRGLFNGIIDATNGISVAINGLVNNVSHLIDDEDESAWQNDLGFMFADLGSMIVEGLGSSAIGLVADIGSIFGADTDWAYDERKGLIPKIHAVASQFKVDVLEGDFEGQDYVAAISGMNNPMNDKILEDRWMTDANYDAKVEAGEVTSGDTYRRYAYKDLMTFMGGTEWVKENIVNPITFNKHFEERYGDNNWYQKVVPATESIGRIIPAVALAYFTGGAGGASGGTAAAATSAKVIGSSYFGASVFGASFEEAIGNGASMNDAYTFATGNMLLELATEQIGGFKFGQKPSISSFNKLMGFAAEEAIEEAVSEFAQKGVSFYGSEDNKINYEESTKDLLSRVGYSMIVGGISGGIFGGGNMFMASRTLEGKAQSLTEALAIESKTVGNAKSISNAKKHLFQMQQALESKNFTEAQKDAMLEENSIMKELFVKQDGEYTLTDTGLKLAQGQIFSTQGEQQITKEVHAVGGNNFMGEYISEVEVKGETHQLPIATKAEVQKMDIKSQEQINFLIDKNVNVAFVKSDGAFNSFVDSNTGIIYVNLNSQEAISNLIAHEINDKIADLGRRGLLTKNQSQAYLDFIKEYDLIKINEIFEAQGKEFIFDEQAYREQYKGRENIEFLMEVERMSAFIQQGFDNEAILLETLEGDQTLFSKIASIFTNKMSFNRVLRAMGLKSKIKQYKTVEEQLVGIQDAFKNVIKLNQENIKAKNDLLNLISGKQEELFSLFPTFVDLDNFQDGQYDSIKDMVSDIVLIKEIVLAEEENIGHEPYVEEVIDEDLKAQGYIFKVDDYLFNINDFHYPKGYNLHGLSYDGATNTFNYSLHNNSDHYTKVVLPDKIIDGELVKKPLIFEAGVSMKVLEFLMVNGHLPSQSVNLEGLGGEQLNAQGYASPMVDEFGNDMKISLVFKNSIVNNEDFFSTKTDSWTMNRKLDASIPDTIRLVNYDIIERDAKDKMKIMYENINHIREVNEREFISKSLGAWNMDETLARLESLVIDEQIRIQNPMDLKRDVLNKMNMDVDIIQLHNEAVSSMETLIMDNVEISDIAQVLTHMLNPNIRVDNKELWVKIFGTRSLKLDEDYLSYFEAIQEYYKHVSYDLTSIAESNTDVAQEQVYAILISHHDNSTKTKDGFYKKVLDYASANDIKIVEDNYGDDFQDPSKIKMEFERQVTQDKKGSEVFFSIKSNKANVVETKQITPTKEVIEGQEDFLDELEQSEVKESYTSETRTQLATKIVVNKKKKVTNRFQRTQRVAKKTTKTTYQKNEDVFETHIEEILDRASNTRNISYKRILGLYNAWKDYITKERTGRRIVNHMSSTASKTIVLELDTLEGLIRNDAARTNKKPTEIELEYIVKKVNEAIFGALKYMDSELRVEINVRDRNPNGYLYTRAIHWYLRDLMEQPKWNKNIIDKFNADKRGLGYRRLINSILNLNKKGGTRELTNAMRHFSNVTNVEPIVDLALDEVKNQGSPHTVEVVKRQWEQDTNNINIISEEVGFNTNINAIIDAFTVSEIVGLFNNSSWSQVLMNKIVRGAERQITIDRVFKGIFEKNNYSKKKHKEIKALESEKNAVPIKNLGVTRVKLSQVMSLRNMMMREMARNSAIDLGIMKGIKTNHFNSGNVVDILEISDIKTDKQDNKQTGKIINNEKLLKELDAIIENDEFMKEYNAMILGLFEQLYPFINERFKEINGLNLRNDGKEITSGLAIADPQVVKDFLEGLPPSVTVENIRQIYVPFLLDNSAYFKNEKVNFKEVVDLGVFDGMTQELSDSDGIISVESINNVATKYKQEVSTYYGLHRIMRDVNIVMNEQLEGYEQTTYVNRNISKQVMNFYKELILDMAGYKPAKRNPRIAKLMSTIRRNFYKASLGANLKVIATQFATMLNLANIYGTGTTFLPKMMANFYAQLTPENKKLLKEMESKNNIYWDRSDMSSFEIGEATTQGITGHNWFNNTTEFLMKGIGVTDNAINKAFYLTLLDSTNPDTKQKYTQEEAGEVLNMAILRSQSSALNITKASLLRTDNEIVKIFLKFMGEPMKLITQVVSSKRHLELIKKIEKNEGKIYTKLENIIEGEKELLITFEKELVVVEAKEDADDFATLPDKQQKDIVKARKEAQIKVVRQQQSVTRQETNLTSVKAQIKETLDGKKKARTLARKRITAVLTVMVYLTTLSVAWNLMRTKGGKKDDEDNDILWKYLIQKMGVGFVDEMFSMFPFVRDAYQLVGKGYDLDNFDEIGSVNDLGKTIYYLIDSITSGRAINWGKTTRLGLGSLGMMFGVPVRGLERLFTTPMLYIDEKTWYDYQNLIGKRDRDNIELADAIKSGDTRMINAVVQHKLDKRNLKVSRVVFTELSRLATVGFEVSMSGINDSYTVDGVEYILSASDKRRFAEIYNKADYIIQKMLRTPLYRRLNDDMKESMLKAIYNYYYKMAKQIVLEVELIPEKNFYTSMTKAFRYFQERAEAFYNTQRSKKYREDNA